MSATVIHHPWRLHHPGPHTAARGRKEGDGVRPGSRRRGGGCPVTAQRPRVRPRFWSHVSVGPRRSSGWRRYWTINKCCGFTRLKTKGSHVTFSRFKKAAWLCTYLLEVKWSMKKWLTCQSNLATANNGSEGGGEEEEDCCWLHSVFFFFFSFFGGVAVVEKSAKEEVNFS